MPGYWTQHIFALLCIRIECNRFPKDIGIRCIKMKKSLLMLAMGGILVACSGTANAAGVALTIDNPFQNAIQGQNTVLTFTGSVLIDPG